MRWFRRIVHFYGRQLGGWLRWRRSRHQSTPEAQRFIEANRAFWAGINEGEPGDGCSGYLLVRLERHALIQFCNASFAAIIARARGLKPLFILTTRPQKGLMQLLESYGPADTICLADRPLQRMYWKACRLADRAYHRLRVPEDLLAFEEDGIAFGDAIYDEVLEGGYATVSAVDERVLRVLERFYFYGLVIKCVMSRHDIRLALFAHYVGLEGATFSRYLVDGGIEMINRLGSDMFAARKCRTLADIKKYPLKMEPQYAEVIFGDKRSELLALADDYLERRFGQQLKHPALDVAFGAEKKIFRDRREFCEAYGMDGERPVIFVMLHAFNDYPHSHFARAMLYQDYYDWFVKTLELARTVTTVNWVFKEHPVGQKYYATKDADMAAIFSAVPPHVLFLCGDANLNARTIPNVAAATVTCVGSAGLEHAAAGVPCILAAESHYSGFGFTMEPSTREEYEVMLRHADKIKRLSNEQVERARIVAYFVFHAMLSTPYHFCPSFPLEEIMEWSEGSERRLWKLAGEALADTEQAGKMKRQVSDLARFIRDAERVQYIEESLAYCIGANE